MRRRRVASLAATVTLAAGALYVAVIATPAIAAVIDTAHLIDTRSTLEHSTPDGTVPSMPAPEPSATYTGPLIAPSGASDITRAQLHVSAIRDGDSENARIWERQQWLIKQCMARRGFLYDPLSETVDIRSLPRDEQKAMQVAAGGPRTDGPYDWRTAGCHGLAVHLTGQDGKD